MDLIVFDGMSEDALREIIFLEVKTGGSSLTTRERRIRDVVLAKKIAWREFRVGGE
ncbi:MAG: Holliday junction resolvase-like protein [Vicinamibacteria bacterium]